MECGLQRRANLKAIGYVKGKKVAASTVVTTTAATKLQITTLPLPVKSDIVLFEIAVTDKAGLKVIDGKNAISVNVAGAGKLIGLDNGELAYSGLYKTDTRNSYEGRLLVAVQRTLNATDGEISITASAPGLLMSALKIK